MRLNAVTRYSQSFSNNANSAEEKKERKESFIDKFGTEIKNSADLNDTVTVPRTIFKGYLAFMSGTALAAIANIPKEKHPKAANFLNIISTALIIYGTFSFVRPYIIKDKI